ncbi:PilN domain-containing protein [Photobacterium indicum]|uniref:MSHA biogenesis protein MshI n=1 Tax=Photobacterium indicum TaxID=81447 RepID=A0A2T3L3X0_9GAMM|nr:MSHA biogenesis protein MshI [Photobacterium indicum]PSV43909.1 MSHA biogenesis protein MshI [Photobacterium indicum]
MKSTALFNKYFNKKSHHKLACLAVFADSITIVYESEQQCITDSIDISGTGQWADAIKSLLEKHDLSGCKLKLVLGHGLYQSLLIEKPDIPRAELPTALPFLVKDLVNESPMDLVADGFPAPLKDRLQVFVANRKHIEQLIKICADANGELIAVSAEEIVWGQFTSSSLSQLILHRRSSAGLQLTAFKQQTLCFQRQLRGFTDPLIGSESDALQLDNLALELQRSLDFLSAQLRDNPINQLVISCDGEDDALLAQELSQRLSVSVSAIAPAYSTLTTNAARVAWAALNQLDGSGINLYSDALKPQRNYLTLPNVIASWAIIVVVMATLTGWYQWKNYVVKEKLAVEQALLTAKRTELDRAKAALAKHVPSPLKVELAGSLEQDLAAKQATLKAIENHDDSLKVGYAGMLKQLSDAASGDISVNRIRATGKALDLEGLARSPDAVPGWLKAFKQYPSLSERRFQLLSLGRNEKNIVTFRLLADRTAAQQESKK